MVVPPIFIAVCFFLACIIKVFAWQFEHALTRGLIAVWYFVVAFLHIPHEWRILVGGILFTFMAVIEIISAIYRGWLEQQYRKALGVIEK